MGEETSPPTLPLRAADILRSSSRRWRSAKGLDTCRATSLPRSRLALTSFPSNDNGMFAGAPLSLTLALGLTAESRLKLAGRLKPDTARNLNRASARSRSRTVPVIASAPNSTGCGGPGEPNGSTIGSTRALSPPTVRDVLSASAARLVAPQLLTEPFSLAMRSFAFVASSDDTRVRCDALSTMAEVATPLMEMGTTIPPGALWTSIHSSAAARVRVAEHRTPALSTPCRKRRRCSFIS